MGGVDILRTDKAVHDPPRPMDGPQRAVVVRAPAGQDDSMWVSPIGGQWTTHDPFEVVAGNWEPRGHNMPLRGNTCLLTFDHRGDAWVPIWNGRTFLQVFGPVDSTVYEWGESNGT